MKKLKIHEYLKSTLNSENEIIIILNNYFKRKIGKTILSLCLLT